MAKAFKVLDKCIEAVEAVLGSVMILCIIIEVLGRYILPFSTTWTEELARYCLVWGMLLGCAYGFGNNGHIIIDVLIHKFGENAKRICRIFSSIFFIVFCVVMFALSIERFPSIAKEFMVMVRVSFGYVFAALPVGLGLSVIYSLRNLVNDLRPKRGEQE